MQIVKRKVSEITANDYNPNFMPEEKYEALKESIRLFDYLQPILIDKDNNIIDGYHRWTACEEVGKKEIQCVVFTGKKEDLIEYKKLLTISMNNIRGENDFDKFQAVLKDIADNIDTESISKLTGIETNYIESITTDMEKFKRGMEGDDFDDILKNFDTGKGQGKAGEKNENWFYVEFYKDDKKYNEMMFFLKDHLLGSSKHQLDSKKFYEMVKLYFSTDEEKGD